jgi:hypothetical protein
LPQAGVAARSRTSTQIDAAMGETTNAGDSSSTLLEPNRSAAV